MPSVQIALMLQCVEICPLSWLLGAGSKWQGPVTFWVSIFLCWNRNCLCFPEKLAERTTFRFSFLRQISQVMRLGGHDSVHDMDFFFFWWTLNRIGRFLKNYLFLMLGLAKTLLHSGLLGMYSSFKKGIASYITFTTSRPLGFPVFRRDSNIEFWGRSFSTSNARTVDLVVRGVPGTWKVRAYTNIYRISYPLPSWFLPLVINTCYTDDFRSRDRTWWIKVMEGNVDIGISGSDMLEEAMIFVCR